MKIHHCSVKNASKNCPFFIVMFVSQKLPVNAVFYCLMRWKNGPTVFGTFQHTRRSNQPWIRPPVIGLEMYGLHPLLLQPCNSTRCLLFDINSDYISLEKVRINRFSLLHYGKKYFKYLVYSRKPREKSRR